MQRNCYLIFLHHHEQRMETFFLFPETCLKIIEKLSEEFTKTWTFSSFSLLKRKQHFKALPPGVDTKKLLPKHSISIKMFINTWSGSGFLETPPSPFQRNWKKKKNTVQQQRLDRKSTFPNPPAQANMRSRWNILNHIIINRTGELDAVCAGCDINELDSSLDPVHRIEILLAGLFVARKTLSPNDTDQSIRVTCLASNL